jgi:hypothetical protein
MPNATSLGRFTGSKEFHGETKIETVTHEKITWELSNLDVADVSMSQGYLRTLQNSQNPAPSEEGTGFWF